MSAPDPMPAIPLGPDGPVFAEPWEAQAFAMAVALHAKGIFTWTEWARELAHCIAEHGESAGYYSHWLAALEHLVVDKGLASAAALADMRAQWAKAAAAAPHGQPIELA